MRILTVRQPWAWAIIHGGKNVENRTQSLGPYRGPVAIHASLAFSEEGLSDPLVTEATVRTGGAPCYVMGVIIGMVDLVDSHPAGNHYEPIGAGVYQGTSRVCCGAWAMRNNHHLVLANPRPFDEPIPAKGRLGLWKPDADLLAAIEKGGRHE